jgi:Phage virion morphogenesis family
MSVYIDYDWQGGLTAMEAELRLAAIEGYVRDTQVLAEAIEDELRVELARRFETETDPSGAKWEPWANPASHVGQIGILRDTTNMYEAALDAFEARPDGVYFDFGSLPEYAGRHQDGDGRVPQRAFVGVGEVSEDRISNMGEAWLAGGIALGARGVVRQFRAGSGRFAGFGG